MSQKPTAQKVFDRGDDIQKKCHAYVEQVLKEKPNVGYQDATNVYLFHKIAELELMVEKLGSGFGRGNEI